jgi:hypothetical protein
VQNLDVSVPSNSSIHTGKRVEENEQFSTTVGNNKKQSTIFEKLSMPIFMVVRTRDMFAELMCLLDIMANR